MLPSGQQKAGRVEVGKAPGEEVPLPFQFYPMYSGLGHTQPIPNPTRNPTAPSPGSESGLLTSHLPH